MEKRVKMPRLFQVWSSTRNPSIWDKKPPVLSCVSSQLSENSRAYNLFMPLISFYIFPPDFSSWWQSLSIQHGTYSVNYSRITGWEQQNQWRIHHWIYPWYCAEQFILSIFKGGKCVGKSYRGNRIKLRGNCLLSIKGDNRLTFKME